VSPLIIICLHLPISAKSLLERISAPLPRTFVSRDVNSLMRDYKVYVRPIIEHNSVVWLPSALHDIDAIERVQKRFTKRLSGFRNCSYELRLKRLNLQSRELRRLLSDLFWCYKIVFGLVDINSHDFFHPKYC